MNEKKAKECRREIYVKQNGRDRKYFHSSVKMTLPMWSRKIILLIKKIPIVGQRLAGFIIKRIVIAVPSGSIIADPKRRAYQNLKKQYLDSKRSN